jgi:two-component system response regulator
MRGSPAILLVDDNSNDVAIALRALRRAGLDASVHVESDGLRALRYLGINGDDVSGPAIPDGSAGHAIPQVVFLDLKMPRMDGWEVLQRIRQDARTREVPVVVISTSRNPDDVQRCYAAGANSFLVKRFDEVRPGDYLVEAARYWLELNEMPPTHFDEGATHA